MTQGSSQRCRHSHRERVTVLHMPKLVGQHASEFVTIQQAHNPFRHCYSRMLGITPSRKRVWRLLRNNVDTWHRHTGPLRELTNHRKQIRGLCFVDFLGTVHPQHNLVRPPVRREVHDPGEHQRYHKTPTTSEGLPHKEQQRCQRCQKDQGLQLIHTTPPSHSYALVVLSAKYVSKIYGPLYYSANRNFLLDSSE